MIVLGQPGGRGPAPASSDFVLARPCGCRGHGNILVKTLARIEWYLKEAVPLFVLGTLLLFGADRLHLLGDLERVMGPLLRSVLGLPPETAEAFVIGFLRRDFGAAGLYRMAQDGRLDPVQVVVATVTITLFIPCVANFLMIVKERGWRTGSPCHSSSPSPSRGGRSTRARALRGPVLSRGGQADTLPLRLAARGSLTAARSAAAVPCAPPATSCGARTADISFRAPRAS